MSRKDVLAVAKAALRLGDWFVPPTGSIVRVDFDKARFRVVPSAFFEDLGSSTFFAEAIDGGAYYSKVQVAPHHKFYLLAVPEGCPPFDTWPRPSCD